MDPQEIPKTYTPKDWESKLYAKWEESGFFNPDNLPGDRTEAFSIIMPPPNANGRLHAGHALFVTVEDIFTRFHRMNGKKALWVPGADHAGFETQVVYERKLEKEGRSRFDLSREALYDEIYNFTMENKGHMESDLRKLGASCDWSRNAFTLDPKIVSIVQDTFRKMFTDGLVYRGKRIVNWCSKHQTGLSDVETENQESISPLYYFQYGPFEIATVRPETKFGDKYVVMHPNDERYKEFTHGQKIEVEWINGPITATILKDEAIDPAFGSGVMTITPWHSQVDYDLALKYDLDFEQIIDEKGCLLPIAQEFAGMNIDEAREKIVEKLQSKGLLVKIEEGYHNVKKVCYKCETVIEPQAREQWFVKMKPLAELALKAVRDNKEIEFHPKNYEKIFTYWMENTIDWNISRQIVWGIPIPAQYCAVCNKGYIDRKAGDTCKCSGTLVAETDTFDTWFSSGQWPLLSLGYPDSPDVATYHPTTVMETGHDLIFKWIPRMVIFSLYLKNEIPFQHVYLHGLVNDEHGQKMSKSKGNVISPIDLLNEYGTDALRLALVIGNAPGNNIPLSFKKVESYRNFANKLWNIGRYINSQQSANNNQQKSAADYWILSRLNETIEEITRLLENYQPSLAGEKLRDFTWTEFADWYVEIHKVEKNDAVLRHVFETLLKLWHPFIPFVTEALWETFGNSEKSLLITEKWPTNNTSEENSEAEAFKKIITLIQEVRAIRSLYRIDPATKFNITVQENSEAFIRNNEAIFKRLARIEEIRLSETIPTHSALAQAGSLRVYIELEGVIDFDAEKKRLEKEISEKEKYIVSLESKLGNKNFIERAKPDIVEKEQSKLQEAKNQMSDLTEHLNSLPH